MKPPEELERIKLYMRHYMRRYRRYGGGYAVQQATGSVPVRQLIRSRVSAAVSQKLMARQHPDHCCRCGIDEVVEQGMCSWCLVELRAEHASALLPPAGRAGGSAKMAFAAGPDR